MGFVSVTFEGRIRNVRRYCLWACVIRVSAGVVGVIGSIVGALVSVL